MVSCRLLFITSGYIFRKFTNVVFVIDVFMPMCVSPIYKHIPHIYVDCTIIMIQHDLIFTFTINYRVNYDSFLYQPTNEYGFMIHEIRYVQEQHMQSERMKMSGITDRMHYIQAPNVISIGLNNLEIKLFLQSCNANKKDKQQRWFIVMLNSNCFDNE